MIRRYIGITLLLLGAASVESDWMWVPCLLIGAGAVLTLTKKKTPSSRQAKEGDLEKFNRINYSMKGENCKE